MHGRHSDGATGGGDGRVAAYRAGHEHGAPRSHASVLVTFGLVLATMAMGYGALFSMLDDIRDEYGDQLDRSSAPSSGWASSPASSPRS